MDNTAIAQVERAELDERYRAAARYFAISVAGIAKDDYGWQRFRRGLSEAAATEAALDALPVAVAMAAEMAGEELADLLTNL